MRAPMKLLIAEGQGLGLVGHQHQNTYSRNPTSVLLGFTVCSCLGGGNKE
jgi:hypothetical protein